MQGSGGMMGDLNQRMDDLDMGGQPGMVGSASNANVGAAGY